MTFELLPERERNVRSLHANINPQQVKGLHLTHAEREKLLERLGELETEIRLAGAYDGALS